MAEYSLGEALLGTGVDTDGLDKGLDIAEKHTRSRFAVIGDVAKGALTLGIGAGLAALGAGVAAVAGGINDARDAAQVMAQTEAVIESTGGAAGYTAEQIAAMASELSAASGQSLFGDADIQRGQNLLLTFTNIRDTLPDATQTLLDMAQAMGTDVSSQAIQLGKALNDPIGGISALTRVGVTFTDEQKAMIQTLVETGDVAGAQTIILEELNREFGGSAAAAAAADGGWAQFNDRLGEAWETIGTAILPLLNQFAAFMNDTVAPALENVIVPAIVSFTQAWTNDAGPAMAEVTAWYASNLQPILENLGEALLPVATTALEILAETWDQVLKPALEALWGFLEEHVLPTLGTLTGFLAEHAPGAMEHLKAVFEQILLPMLRGFVDFLRYVIFPLLQFFIDMFFWIAQAILGAILAVQDFIRNLSQVSIPYWLEGHSPPPLANWLTDIGDAMAGVTMEIPAMADLSGITPLEPSYQSSMTMSINDNRSDLLRDLIRVEASAVVQDQALAGAARRRT